MKKATKTNKNIARSPQKRAERGANVRQIRFAFVPIVREFRAHTQKNQARLWIPIETSLLVRYEFASCSLQTRYILVAIVLYCGANGIDEIPLDAKFMASVLVADERTIAKSFDELLFKNLLVERKEREKEKTDTDRLDAPDARVSVDVENFSQEEAEKENENGRTKISSAAAATQSQSNGHLSQFSLADCLRYVEKCQADGDRIENARALAQHLFKTGEADAFIMNALYPEQSAREQFGEPRRFTDEPCSICFGAKMADVDGKGYAACSHCKNERGKATGFEPSEIS